MELGPDYDFTMARIILNTNCQCLLSLRDLTLRLNTSVIIPVLLRTQYL